MSDPYIGEIRMFAGNFAPVGWLFCQGQTLAISDYDALFNLIGTTYGGDGQTTFALPDLSSRIPVHQGANYPLGARGGAETVTLDVRHLPPHSHQAFASSSPAVTALPMDATWGGAARSAYSGSAPSTALSGASLMPAGGGQPHENMPPFLAVNFIISLFGIYPSNV